MDEIGRRKKRIWRAVEEKACRKSLLDFRAAAAESAGKAATAKGMPNTPSATISMLVARLNKATDPTASVEPMIVPTKSDIWVMSMPKIRGRKRRPISRTPRCVKSSAILNLKPRSEEHTSELQSQSNLVCRLLL